MSVARIRSAVTKGNVMRGAVVVFLLGVVGRLVNGGAVFGGLLFGAGFVGGIVSGAYTKPYYPPFKPGAIAGVVGGIGYAIVLIGLLFAGGYSFPAADILGQTVATAGPLLELAAFAPLWGFEGGIGCALGQKFLSRRVVGA